MLVAEQLFASGCNALVSITSAGRVAEIGDPPYAVLIDRALRDEGTSIHYLGPEAGQAVAAPDPALLARAEAAMREAFPAAAATSVHRGMSWTTRLVVTVITLAVIICILLFERSGLYVIPWRE